MTKKLEIAKDWIMDKLCLFVMKHKPERLRAYIAKEVNALVQEVSVQASMQYLNRQGLIHCAMCPQRFGLQRAKMVNDKGEKREVYLCVTHYTQSGAARTQEVVHV